VILVFFSMNLHKHRVAGKPFVLGGATTAPATAVEKPTIVTTAPHGSVASKGKEAEEVPRAEDKKAGPECAKEGDGAAIV
jgi:hypothetical protein